MTGEDPTPAIEPEPSTEGPSKLTETDRILLSRVRQQQSRAERARREPAGSLWRTVAQVGTLGWLIALPPVAGAFLGHMLDMRYQTGVVWALSLLGLGLVVAAYFFWRSMREAEVHQE